MKFMLLVHHNETVFEQMSEDERQRLLAESIALTHELHAQGQYVSASPLHPTSTNELMVEIIGGGSVSVMESEVIQPFRSVKVKVYVNTETFKVF